MSGYFSKHIVISTFPNVTSHPYRSQWPRGLRCGLRLLPCWDYEFESRRGHGYLSLVSVVCCAGTDHCVGKKDAERLGIRNWRTKAMDRDGWSLVIESAKTLHWL
jgi:hypothetical protein